MDKVIRLWDVATGKERARFSGSGNEILSVTFLPDGRLLASSAYDTDTVVRVWEVATGKEVRRFEGHKLFVTGVAFAPDGRTVASAGRDGDVRLWDVTGRLREGRLEPAQPNRKELINHWGALLGADAESAHRAGWALAAAPRQAVPFLRERLRPATPDPDLDRRVAGLIANLADPRFGVRERSAAELKALGARIQGALRKALEPPLAGSGAPPEGAAGADRAGGRPAGGSGQRVGGGGPGAHRRRGGPCRAANSGRGAGRCIPHPRGPGGPQAPGWEARNLSGSRGRG